MKFIVSISVQVTIDSANEATAESFAAEKAYDLIKLPNVRVTNVRTIGKST